MADTALVQIVNTALAALGQEPVTDLEEAELAGSLSAVKLMRHVETARETVLRRHGFTCALEYVTLSPASPPGYLNWRYPTVYELPGDALRVWEIEGVTAADLDPGCWEPRWQAGTLESESGARQIIRARNATAQLNVAYIRRANWRALDAHVADAVAFEIAKRGAYAVTADRVLSANMAKEAEGKALMAISTDGQQEGGQPALAGSIPQMIRNLSR